LILIGLLPYSDRLHMLLLLLLAERQPKLLQQLLQKVWRRLIARPGEGPKHCSHVTTAQPLAAATRLLHWMLQQDPLLLWPAAGARAAARLMLHAPCRQQLR
jgi:hypothetical protein